VSQKLLTGDSSITCWFEVLQASVEGPCLHRPGNWLVRQLKDESKPVYKVGFIRERKGYT
jgi:hypothetical protein